MHTTSTPVKRKPQAKKSRTAPRRKPAAKARQQALRFWAGLGVLAVLALLVLYVEFFVEKGRTIWPQGHSVYGIDVSHFQKEVDWLKVRESEISFAFVKATEGKSLQDKHFAANWQGAQEAGIVRGAYHFYLPHVDPKLQAKNFIATVKLAPGDLPPVLDVEVRGRKPLKRLRRDLQVWLRQVEDAYGVKPIIYTSYKFYQDYLAGHFDDYHLWIAHYKVPQLQLERSSKVKLAFWQHTDEGTIEGVEGSVDCNVFYGSMRELRSVCVPARQ